MELNNWLFNADDVLKTGSIILFAIIIFLETGTLFGLLVPGGDYMILAAGISIGTNVILIHPLVLILILWVAAIAGDCLGFYQGLVLGNKLLNKEDSYLFKKKYVFQAQAFYAKYKSLAFIAGRFVPVVRTFMPLVAGASKLPFRKFFMYAASGAFCWLAPMITLGYILGRFFPQITGYTHYLLLAIVVMASFPFIKLAFTLITNRTKG